MHLLFFLTFLLMIFGSCSTRKTTATSTPAAEKNELLHYPQEKNLRNIKQLTFGGDNAEAYFSFDDQMLVFQRMEAAKNIPCDQIFYGKLDHSSTDTFNFTRISNGLGRTTCAYFMPGNKSILYSSTHETASACPPTPDRPGGKYVWPIYNSYDIYVADLNGNLQKKLSSSGFYDAEATVSPKGDKIVFTSNRNGDMELYTMNIDGSDVQQVTHELGYDGGAFFSPDGTQLVFRASRPNSPEEMKEYRDLLAQGLVQPTEMEIFVCDVDGKNLRQITNLGGANWAPYFHPSGDKIVFSSNHHSERGFPFNIFIINVDGTGLKQLTFDNQFDSFPMFSFDGKHLVWGSNRNNGGTRDTNVFIAEWVEQ